MEYKSSYHFVNAGNENYQGECMIQILIDANELSKD